jgi:hypothetical protein
MFSELHVSRNKVIDDAVYLENGDHDGLQCLEIPSHVADLLPARLVAKVRSCKVAGTPPVQRAEISLGSLVLRDGVEKNQPKSYPPSQRRPLLTRGLH